MQVIAQLNNLRIAPRKVRLAAMILRGMPVERAEAQLKFRVKRSAGPLAKLLKSAVSNAEKNFGLVKENLFIKELTVNEGVKIKRFMPRAMGQAGMIQKKSSRVKIVLEEKVPGLKRSRAEVASQLKSNPKTQEEEVKKESWEKSKGGELKQKAMSGQGRGVLGGVRRFFRRKSI